MTITIYEKDEKGHKRTFTYYDIRTLEETVNCFRLYHLDGRMELLDKRTHTLSMLWRCKNV